MSEEANVEIKTAEETVEVKKKTSETVEPTEKVTEEVESKTEEVSKDNSDVKEVEEVEEVEDNSDIFITEEDRFDVEIEYYIDGKEPVIKDFDDEYYSDGKEVKSFTVTFKYPSQRDADAIMLSRPIDNLENATFNDLIQLENMRLVTLLRSWSLKQSLEEIVNLHPKMIKAIRSKLSDEIGGSGLF